MSTPGTSTKESKLEHPSAAAKSGPAESRRLSGEDRRRQLLDNATELFSRHGFSGTRTKDIASACGVSEGILFRHFNTKEDLYRAILDNYEAGSGDWLGEMKRRAAVNDDEGFVRYLASQILNSFREETAFHRLMAYARLEGHSMVHMFHERMGLPTFDFIRAYIERRQKEGAFRAGDPALMAMSLFSPSLQYALSMYVFGRCPIPLTEPGVLDEITVFSLAGLRAPASPATESESPRQERQAE